MSMPAVVIATAFDFYEVHAAVLGRSPGRTPAELHERRVQSIDILLEGSAGLAKRQGDESDGSVFRKLTDAVSDMSSSLL